MTSTETSWQINRNATLRKRYARSLVIITLLMITTVVFNYLNGRAILFYPSFSMACALFVLAFALFRRTVYRMEFDNINGVLLLYYTNGLKQTTERKIPFSQLRMDFVNETAPINAQKSWILKVYDNAKIAATIKEEASGWERAMLQEAYDHYKTGITYGPALA